MSVTSEAFVGVPVARRSQHSWVPTTRSPAPDQLGVQLQEDDEGVIVSWRDTWLPGHFFADVFETFMALAVISIYAGIIVGVLSGAVSLGLICFIVVLVPLFTLLTVANLAAERTRLWPLRHVLALTPNAVQHTSCETAPAWASAAAAVLLDGGSPSGMVLVPRDSLLDVSVAAHRIVLKSSDGGLMELAVPDNQMEHWLCTLLGNWRRRRTPSSTLPAPTAAADSVATPDSVTVLPLQIAAEAHSTGSKAGAVIGVPVTASGVTVASWVPAVEPPGRLVIQRLNTGDGSSDRDCVIVSWRPEAQFFNGFNGPGFVWVLLGIAMVYVTMLSGPMLLLDNQKEVAAGIFGVVMLLTLPVCIIFALVANEESLWPARHVLTITPESAKYTKRDTAPGWFRVIKAAGAELSATATVPRALVRVSFQGKARYSISLVSGDGGLIELDLLEKRMQHWLHTLLQSWRSSGGGIGGSARGVRPMVPLALARPNGVVAAPSAIPFAAAAVLL